MYLGIVFLMVEHVGSARIAGLLADVVMDK
jgi:GrpB-like predicted nucleotidyltransferase (UPF0157 family)